MEALCAGTNRNLATKEHKENHALLGGDGQPLRHHLGSGGRGDFSSLCSSCSFVANLLLALTAFVAFSANAQIQQAWVAHYNNGITNGTNQAVKMALDPTGNIYVTGFSQNTDTNLGYVTIKYAPNGNQVWASRYDATNFPNAKPTAMIVDSNDEVIVTGSALTVKYDPNGNQLWTAPYGGLGIAGDSFGDSYVTGFGTNFNTVKLAPTGSSLWISTYMDVGPTIGQGIVIDSNGNVFVSGSDTYYYTYPPGFTNPSVALLSIKYESNGNQVWASQYQYSDVPGVQLGAMAIDAADNVYLVANFQDATPYVTTKYSSNGTDLWSQFPGNNFNNSPHGLVVNSAENVLLVGQMFHGGHSGCSTIEFNANGATVFDNLFPPAFTGTGGGMAIAVDSANNAYVTGYSPGTNSLNDIVTIKYGPNGNQVWLQRYNGPGNGNDAGNAIAVDNNGNVYVAGYDTTTAGGTEMVLIKYSPVTVQKRADGSILLQAQGSPGENFDIQASPDLLNWLDLGIVTVDTNGLMQFNDTNAANYPARFYYTNPQ